MQRLLFIASGLFFLAACSGSGSTGSGSVGAARLHVDTQARGKGDGSSWEHALGSLQTALALAPTGSEIWLRSGEYRPAGLGGDRLATFELHSGLTIRGGFAGGETSPDQRLPENAPTILSGDLNGDDRGLMSENRSDNVYHVVSAHMVMDTVLERLTICGGHADGPGQGAHFGSHDQGSGVNVFHSHLRFESCLVTQNYSANHGAINDHGGCHFTDCAFVGNRAGLLGAGLYIHGDVEALVEGCRFLGNETPGQGAGLYTRSFLPTLIRDCHFAGNRAERGAGLYMAPGSKSTLENSRFDENVAQVGGGGTFLEESDGIVRGCMYVANAAGADITKGGGGGGGSGGGGIWISAGAPLVEGCCFNANIASFGAGVYHIDESRATVRGCIFQRGIAFEAGGLYSLQSPVTVQDCLFFENYAYGGAFSVGGALSIYIADALIERCLVVNNQAELGGGGIYVEGGASQVRECHFASNVAFGDTQGWGGGALIGYFSQVRFSSCAFESNRANKGGALFSIVFTEPTLTNITTTGNLALQEGGSIYAYESSAIRIENSILWGDLPQELAGAAVSIERSCVEGGAVGLAVHSLPPLFVTAPDAGPDGEIGTADDLFGDLQLGPGSPCIDAGDNGWLLETEGLDCASAPRRSDDPAAADSGAGASPQVDLGAYERQP